MSRLKETLKLHKVMRKFPKQSHNKMIKAKAIGKFAKTIIECMGCAPVYAPVGCSVVGELHS